MVIGMTHEMEKERTVKERFARLPAGGVEGRLVLEEGGRRDYAVLAGHHYKARAPVTFGRVIVLRDKCGGVGDRYLGRGGSGRVVGVLVESYSTLSCRLRDFALHNRYGQIRDMRQRAVVINAEVRCISRVVVHPQWRGLGLAVRLVKASLTKPETAFTEALAAMGSVHPFFERAGMTAYRRPAHVYDARLGAALKWVGIEPMDLAVLDETERRIMGLADGERRWLLGELDRWYRQVMGRRRNRSDSVGERLRLAQQRLLCEPVYFLKDNRAGGGEVGGVPRCDAVVDGGSL